MKRSGDVAVHQILPALHAADASGSHTLRLRDALRGAGFRSEVFCGQSDDGLESEAFPFATIDDHVVNGDTILIYQLAVGSSIVYQLLERKEPLIVNYHNLTPAVFFHKWAPEWLDAVASGRRQLYELADRTALAIADSAFNAIDLKGAGYRNVQVTAPLVAVRHHASHATRELPDKGARWLFVGKLLPHKCAHDAIKALAVYRSTYDPDAKLFLVGSSPLANYRQALEDFSKSLGLGEAVVFVGSVADAERDRLYRSADLFLCLSEHEGFCFPLLEAMSAQLPIVAFDAGAVASTLGDGGVLINDKSPHAVATAARRVLTDAVLQLRLLAAAEERLKAFDPNDTQALFVNAIRALCDEVL